MFLKSLELYGFKSFADKTRLEFGEGITSLLGPNGCGKSNVVDAIKWVLGEQSTKTLRAGKMEDVIFNGTENRQALNVAEVSLVIGNEGRLLPIDHSEVEIRRRLFRSGESEFYINRNLVRLRDVRELFWDTGIGKSAYSILEQGKIDQILSTRPEDRRYIFEEAAGITRYKQRSLEAGRKLERTEENIEQVETLLGEIKRQYDLRKSQASKLVRYRELEKELTEIEVLLQLSTI
ncbi:MAG: AAA family ATPase, partial [Sphaerochaetaceae bacterium]